MNDRFAFYALAVALAGAIGLAGHFGLWLAVAILLFMLVPLVWDLFLADMLTEVRKRLDPKRQVDDAMKDMSEDQKLQIYAVAAVQGQYAREFETLRRRLDKLEGK